MFFFFFFQAEDGIRDIGVTGVQTCALPISSHTSAASPYMAGHTTIVTQPAERRFSPPDAFAPTSCAHASKLRQPHALDIARPAGETQHRNHADRRNVAGARTNAIQELSRWK